MSLRQAGMSVTNFFCELRQKKTVDKVGNVADWGSKVMQNLDGLITDVRVVVNTAASDGVSLEGKSGLVGVHASLGKFGEYVSDHVTDGEDEGDAKQDEDPVS